MEYTEENGIESTRVLYDISGRYGAYIGPDRVIYVRNRRPVAGYIIPDVVDREYPFLQYIEKLLRGIELTIKDRGHAIYIDVSFPEVWIGVKLLPDRALIHVPEIGILTLC